MRVLTVDFMVGNVTDQEHAAEVLDGFLSGAMAYVDTSEARFGFGLESWVDDDGKKGFVFNTIFYDAVMNDHAPVWEHEVPVRILKAEKMYGESQVFGEPIVAVLQFGTEKMQKSESEKMQIGNQ